MKNIKIISKEAGFGIFKARVPGGRKGEIKKGRCRTCVIKPKLWERLLLRKSSIRLQRFEYGVDFGAAEIEWFPQDECELFVDDPHGNKQSETQ